MHLLFVDYKKASNKVSTTKQYATLVKKDENSLLLMAD
jgi:hypothetical protein